MSLPPAIVVEGISKTYRNVRVGSQDTSLREQFTALLRPWRLFLGAWRHHNRHNDVEALRPISFTVRPGEKLGILGRNGSGKSTLLKILARITVPTEGRAVIRGRVAAILEVGTGFHPELTGAENIFLNGAILGLKQRFVHEHFDEIVAFAELQDFLDLPVKRYSSGMYVRLAFAIAAHLESDVLLVDEVLAVGDESFREKCLAKLDAEVARGRTVLFVTHGVELVRRFCDRTLVLHRGMLEHDGDVETGIALYHERCQTLPASRPAR
jgi:lipopolysaccharide transport system ATP-binding protein